METGQNFMGFWTIVILSMLIKDHTIVHPLGHVERMPLI
jgi:hypothetical protein